MIRLLKWERKFYWLDGGGGGGGGGDGDGTGDSSDGAAGAGTGEGEGEGEGGGTAGSATGGGGPESLGRALEAVGGAEIQTPSQEAKPKEKKEEEKKKKRRPTLLTQLEGLLTGQGIRRSLIGR